MLVVSLPTNITIDATCIVSNSENIRWTVFLGFNCSIDPGAAEFRRRQPRMGYAAAAK